MTLSDFYLSCAGSLEQTLSRLGSERLIRKYLLRLPEDGSCRELLSAYENMDTEAVFRAAHTMKGIASNLGLPELYRASDALAQALRAARDPAALDGISHLYSSLVCELNRVKSLIGEIDP